MLGLGFQEMMVILVLGVLLFGSKLPNIGRSLGKTIVEFKRGLHGVEDEIEQATHSEPSPLPAPQPARPPERLSPAAPKFEDQAEPARTGVRAEPKPEPAPTVQA
jgi:sec-independent protein translocase protein TatA